MVSMRVVQKDVRKGVHWDKHLVMQLDANWDDRLDDPTEGLMVDQLE